MSEFDFENIDFPKDIGPLELVQPYAERVVNHPGFMRSDKLTAFEYEALSALYAFASQLELIGREYIVTASSDVVYIPPDDDQGVYIPEGENQFVGRMFTYDIKKIEDDAGDFSLYAIGIYLNGVRISYGDDVAQIERISEGQEGELFAPVMPINSIERMIPRH